VDDGAALGHVGQYALGQHAKTEPIDRHDLLGREAAHFGQPAQFTSASRLVGNCSMSSATDPGSPRSARWLVWGAQRKGSEVDRVNLGIGPVQQVEGRRSYPTRCAGQRDRLAIEAEKVVHSQLSHKLSEERRVR